MHLSLILEMARSGMGDRVALSTKRGNLTYEELAALSSSAGARFAAAEAGSVVYLGPNHPAFPVALFGAAAAGVPFVPLNYRLGAAQLRAQLGSQRCSYVIGEGGAVGVDIVEREEDPESFLDALEGAVPGAPAASDPDAPALRLHTSGTTSAPKVAVLRHRHLMAYLLGTVGFAGAAADEANLVSVPTYHIAGVANLLSNLYAGRRVVYLESFDPGRWLDTVRREGITHAMVIPTMLARIVDHLASSTGASTPSLRSLSYGGSRTPAPVLRRALELFPSTEFVNAYGLTETSSTIALLGPEDHRLALASPDPEVRRRLDSVGRLLPGVELQVRDEEGTPLTHGESGSVFLRGEQVSGEYEGPGDDGGSGSLDPGGWFSTRDRGWVDQAGYLYIEGRFDETIIRGGENIAPAEIEDVLLAHDQVTDAVVVGLPDEEWGQSLAAVVVLRNGASELGPEELKSWVRDHLRTGKTPGLVEIWSELPRTDTGKLLRREVTARLTR